MGNRAQQIDAAVEVDVDIEPVLNADLGDAQAPDASGIDADEDLLALGRPAADFLEETDVSGGDSPGADSEPDLVSPTDPAGPPVDSGPEPPGPDGEPEVDPAPAPDLEPVAPREFPGSDLEWVRDPYTRRVLENLKGIDPDQFERAVNVFRKADGQFYGHYQMRELSESELRTTDRSILRKERELERLERALDQVSAQLDANPVAMNPRMGRMIANLRRQEGILEKKIDSLERTLDRLDDRKFLGGESVETSGGERAQREITDRLRRSGVIPQEAYQAASPDLRDVDPLRYHRDHATPGEYDSWIESKREEIRRMNTPEPTVIKAGDGPEAEGERRPRSSISTYIMKADEFVKLAQTFGDNWEGKMSPDMEDAFRRYVDRGLDPGDIRERKLRQNPNYRSPDDRRREADQRQEDMRERFRQITERTTHTTQVRQVEALTGRLEQQQQASPNPDTAREVAALRDWIAARQELQVVLTEGLQANRELKTATGDRRTALQQSVDQANKYIGEHAFIERGTENGRPTVTVHTLPNPREHGEAYRAIRDAGIRFNTEVPIPDAPDPLEVDPATPNPAVEPVAVQPDQARKIYEGLYNGYRELDQLEIATYGNRNPLLRDPVKVADPDKVSLVEQKQQALRAQIDALPDDMRAQLKILVGREIQDNEGREDVVAPLRVFREDLEALAT